MDNTLNTALKVVAIGVGIVAIAYGVYHLYHRKDDDTIRIRANITTDGTRGSMNRFDIGKGTFRINR